MNDKYTKITYQSEPIGKEKIVLQLTTFDLEAFKKDEKLIKIPQQRKAIVFEFDRYDVINNHYILEEMNNQFENFIKETYEKQLNEMKNYIEINRAIPKAQWIPEQGLRSDVK